MSYKKLLDNLDNILAVRTPRYYDDPNLYNHLDADEFISREPRNLGIKGSHLNGFVKSDAITRRTIETEYGNMYAYKVTAANIANAKLKGLV